MLVEVPVVVVVVVVSCAMTIAGVEAIASASALAAKRLRIGFAPVLIIPEVCTGKLLRFPGFPALR
jgi:hypothetical protein